MGNKIIAVFKMNAKEILLNMSMLTSVLLPVLMTLMFRQIDMVEGQTVPFIIINVIVGITFASALGAIVMGLLAEENEYGTMDHMLTSKKEMAANMMGKALLLFVITFVILGINLIIIGYTEMLTFGGIPSLLLIWLFFFFISAGFGMLSNSVASSSLFIMIILFVFAMAPYIELLIDDRTNMLRQFFELTPVYQVKFIEEGAVAVPHLILTVWLIVSFIFFLAIFSRKAKPL
ncbi:hypothetical protein [Salinicoccus sp. YB14-2]|uniref:hypothetical protein n=1 Tax=Salinicoccus sp. YB14-2 TaxID=1572701 RepID=UPI00068B46C8|nr:hypothetical protein [Salinicoccus sp. YB14-2]